jgi:hypothetical protein
MVISGVCWAQPAADLFSKAPPDIEEALRARVEKFYGYYVSGKYRAADELVEEGSKDAFFSMGKRRCRSFFIDTIRYSEDYSKAEVSIFCDTDVFVGVGVIEAKVPMRSTWKIVGGQWFWYLDPPPSEGLPSPFGPFKAGGGGAGPGPGALPPAPMTLEGLMTQVKADRQRVQFDPDISSVQRVKISNSMPGSVTLALEPKSMTGIKLALDKAEITQGQSATLSISYEADKDARPSPVTVRIVVSPIDTEIPVRIEFASTSK